MSTEDNVPATNQAVSAQEAEMALRKQLDDHQYEFALASLQAQERDREAERAHNRISQKNALWFFAGTGFVILIITIAAFCLNKEQFLLECIKYLAVGGGGGGIGYFFGYRRAKNQQ